MSQTKIEHAELQKHSLKLFIELIKISNSFQDK